MDDQKSNDSNKNIDEIMLPGFRFHPTDEELVEFYLKRKLEHRSLPIELIKQVDIYKYDPWDLPKVASSGEKEWYFYCPRDRKYRNSTRPNRVTGSGFWKATGTDRPIYSSDGTKCIGLKKSLVFYRGRAAKGIKTDWMMHEFRLPSTTHAPPKKIFDKSFPPSDSWAICRIFKKISSMANRAISHSFSETTTSSDPLTYTPIFNPDNQLFQQTNFSYRNQQTNFQANTLFSHSEQLSGTSTVDLSSMLFNLGPGEACNNSESIDFEMPQNQFTGGFSINSPQVVEANMHEEDDEEGFKKNETNILNMWENIKSIGFPFAVPWDSPPCPSQVSSTTHSTNKSIYS